VLISASPRRARPGAPSPAAKVKDRARLECVFPLRTTFGYGGLGKSSGIIAPFPLEQSSRNPRCKGPTSTNGCIPQHRPEMGALSSKKTCLFATNFTTRAAYFTAFNVGFHDG
jgi:hypothetical protein